ncbi:MAG: hypothetical protein HYZ49_13855 [Chloroflexi bacterium]|nr:hypothetical protein [Chloroflexota bacterium]
MAQSSAQVAAGSFAARASTSSSGSAAKVRYNFSDSAGSHAWEERPGTYYWQWANVYLPSSTVAQLGPTEYLTIAGLWPSASGTQGWFLRVRQGGEMYVVGNRDFDNAPIEFRVYGTFPQDQWVDLEIGLHSQSGPGVKRAFAFLLNGNFYGWYHQGRMQGETYDQAGLGILSTNSNDPLNVFVDQWRFSTSASLPSGPDNRSTASLQQQDYTNQSGVQWQIDWTTWESDLRLESPYGLYSNTNRLQSGRNLDRMPDLTSGWAEIEVDWPKGTPGLSPSSYFGPMVGFRKEINREENLEIIPIGYGGGNVRLTFEAWVGNPVILADWQMPLNAAGASRIPEPGDIIRTRWDQVTATDLNVRVSYYDASTATWHANIINITLDVTAINDSDPGTNAVDYTDGLHTASSVTIDSSVYSIRRFQVGTLGTYPGP